MPYFIYRALINEYIPIYGNGEQQADFVYVQDVVKAADLIMEKEILRKVKEALIAFWMESVLSKKRILELYLNV